MRNLTRVLEAWIDVQVETNEMTFFVTLEEFFASSTSNSQSI